MTRAAASAPPTDVPEWTEADRQAVLTIVAKHRDDRGGLIAMLEAIQQRYGYLPREAIRTVAERTGRSLVDVYGIATFYRAFSMVPRGRHLVCACLGTACHVRGAARVVDEFERRLGIKAGETTADGEFTFETVNCLGACALGPVVVIDGHYFSKVRESGVRQLLQRALAGLDTAQTGRDKRAFPIDVSCPRCNHSLMDAGVPIDGRASIRCTVSFDHGHGWLRLSSLYGRFQVSAEREIPAGAVVSFFCPHCHEQLLGRATCAACEAPMVPMMVHGGGVLQVCSRRGCESHTLDLA